MTAADFPGRVKNKLADRLYEKGFEVSPWDLEVCRERICGGDGIRWQASGYIASEGKHGRRIRFYSFDTMTDCARWGVVAHNLESDLEFSADEPK